MNKYWLLAVFTALFVMFFTAFTGGAGLYFAKGVLGDTAYYAQFANFFSITQMISLFISFVPMKKIGKRNTMLIGLVVVAVGSVLMVFYDLDKFSHGCRPTCKSAEARERNKYRIRRGSLGVKIKKRRIRERK